VEAERAFLRRLGSGCHLAAGAWGRTAPDGSLLVTGFLASDRGAEMVREEVSGDAGDPDALGTRLAEAILERSSDDLKDELAGGTE
jgi:hydroxymethylbilane synthase